MSTIRKMQDLRPIKSTGAQGFLDWLKKYQPALFEKVKGQIPAGAVSGLGIDALTGSTASASTTTATPGWSDTIKNLLTAASQAYLTKQQLDAQQQILNMQLDRAKNGLSPLDIDPSKMGIPSVNVGVSGDTKKWLTYAGIGAALLVAFRMFSGRRARR